MIKHVGTPASGFTTAKPADATYKVTNIALEFDKVGHEGLASAMVSRCSRLALPLEGTPEQGHHHEEGRYEL